MKFKSLKSKVLFWFMGTTSILLFLFSFFVYYFLEESINLKIQKNLYYSATSIYNKLLKADGNMDLNNFIDYEVAIIKDKKVISQTKDFKIQNIDEYISINEIFFLNELEDDKVNAVYILKIEKPFKGMILINKKNLINKAEDLEHILMILDPILLLFLFLIGNRLIDKILKPIKELTKSAKNISIDNFAYTLEIPKNINEITELTESFNEMIERLQSQVDIIDRFNSDVSHELKTPLTIIQGELELCLRKPRDEEFYKKSIQIALNQTSEIEEMINALLLLTKYSKQNIKDTFTKCHLDSMILNICDKYEKEFLSKCITLEIRNLESLVLDANQFLIYAIFSNIIDNALKYTQDGKNIYISLYKKEKKIYFIVKDNGIGIKKDIVNKITDRFYRVDESRNKSIKGFGLGLSIVKNSIELHNGSLKIKSIQDKGTIVKVAFNF